MPPPTSAGRFASFTCAIVVESEEMVDAAINGVREASGRVLAEPVAREWGGHSGYFSKRTSDALPLSRCRNLSWGTRW